MDSQYKTNIKPITTQIFQEVLGWQVLQGKGFAAMGTYDRKNQSRSGDRDQGSIPEKMTRGWGLRMARSRVEGRTF